MRMKPCDEEKSNAFSLPSFQSFREKIEVSENLTLNCKELIEATENSMNISSCSDAGIASNQTGTSKKRKIENKPVSGNGHTPPPVVSDISLPSSLLTFSFMLQTFQQSRQSLPLPIVRLIWKDVLWKGNNRIERRLLLYKTESNKAYDGDFGFLIYAQLLEEERIEENNFIYYSSTKKEKKKVMPIFVRRNRSQWNPLARSQSYRIPHFDSALPHEQCRWHLAQREDTWEFGFVTNRDFLRLEVIEVHFCDLPEPPIEGGTISVRVKKVLKATIDEGRFLYFDCQDQIEAATVGRCLHPLCRYGDVYLGQELSLKVTEMPSSSIFCLEGSRPVVIKSVAFDVRLSAMSTLPTLLQEVERQFTKNCLTENVVHEIEAMLFLQSHFSVKTEEQEQVRFCRLLDYLADDCNLYAITQSYQGGTLLDYTLKKTRFKKLPEIEAKYVIRQVAEAIQQLHSVGMAHQDISPENIVLDHESIPEMITPGVSCVLIDFGQAVGQLYSPTLKNFLKLPPRRQNVGKLPFHCPELSRLQGEYFRGKHVYCPQKVDVWQLGILLYILLTGCPPFSLAKKLDPQKQFTDWIQFLKDKTVRQREVVWRTDTKVNPEQLTSLCDTYLSEEVLSLLSDLLTLSPEERPDITQVLQHEWFQCTSYN